MKLNLDSVKSNTDSDSRTEWTVLLNQTRICIRQIEYLTDVTDAPASGSPESLSTFYNTLTS